jgi:hypothetical protein
MGHAITSGPKLSTMPGQMTSPRYPCPLAMGTQMDMAWSRTSSYPSPCRISVFSVDTAVCKRGQRVGCWDIAPFQIVLLQSHYKIFDNSASTWLELHSLIRIVWLKTNFESSETKVVKIKTHVFTYHPVEKLHVTSIVSIMISIRHYHKSHNYRHHRYYAVCLSLLLRVMAYPARGTVGAPQLQVAGEFLQHLLVNVVQLRERLSQQLRICIHSNTIASKTAHANTGFVSLQMYFSFAFVFCACRYQLANDGIVFFFLCTYIVKVHVQSLVYTVF